jgi:acyl-CoA synthetase (AMP-forming)/AMP-acid ligase II
MSRTQDHGLELLERLPDLPALGDYLDHWAAATPHAEATVHVETGRRLTYSQLAARVAEAEAALRRAGVGCGDRVAMLSTPRPEFWIVFLATIRLGAVWMGLNPRYSLEELRHPLADAKPKLVFAFARVAGRDLTPELSRLRTDGDITHLVLMEPADLDGEDWAAFVADAAVGVSVSTAGTPRPAARDPALLVYTSGTTGRPKGAMLSHRGLVLCSRVQASHIGHLGQRVLNNLPVNHVGCVGDISAWTLVLGGALVFMERFDPAGVVRALGRERITCWGQVPTMFQLTLEHPDWPQADVSSLRYITWSGAMAPRPLIEAFRRLPVKLGSAYGMTETVGSVTFADDHESLDVLAETVGRPDPHYEVRVADPNGVAIADGAEGEVQVRGEFLMLGYLNRPDATQAAFTADGWLKTGDAAVRRPDGTIRLVGRLIEMFKSGGYNVYPREVELALEAHPEILQAAVVPRPDEVYGEVGVAFVAPRTGSGLDEGKVLAHCRAQLANYKVPKAVRVVDSLPMLPIGKVDRAALRRALEDKP